MPRIRTIKPEFWTSEQITECSVSARLLFIGLWNFCDDEGRHVASPKRLQMEVFPGDDFSVADITGFINELLRHGLLFEYEAEKQVFWQVTGWSHQRINRPQPSRIPAPLTDHSLNVHGAFTAEGKEGKEGNTSCPGKSPDEAPGPKPKRPGPKYAPDDLTVAEWIWGRIREMQPTRKHPNLQKWADTVRLMRERDKRTHDQVRDLFARIQADSFWRLNVLSPDKLREKWDDLQLRLDPASKQDGKPASEYPEARHFRDKEAAYGS